MYLDFVMHYTFAQQCSVSKFEDLIILLFAKHATLKNYSIALFATLQFDSHGKYINIDVTNKKSLKSFYQAVIKTNDKIWFSFTADYNTAFNESSGNYWFVFPTAVFV